MYELIEHTADIRIRVAASSMEELFRDSLRGLMDYIGGGLPDGAGGVEEVTIHSGDATALLVDFLNEALLRCHLTGVVFNDVTFSTLTDTTANAILTGKRPAEMAEDVKAVTYHEAHVRRQSDGLWTTTIVLDI